MGLRAVQGYLGHGECSSQARNQARNTKQRSRRIISHNTVPGLGKRNFALSRRLDVLKFRIELCGLPFKQTLALITFKLFELHQCFRICHGPCDGLGVSIHAEKRADECASGSSNGPNRAAKHTTQYRGNFCNGLADISPAHYSPRT